MTQPVQDQPVQDQPAQALPGTPVVVDNTVEARVQALLRGLTGLLELTGLGLNVQGRVVLLDTDGTATKYVLSHDNFGLTYGPAAGP